MILQAVVGGFVLDALFGDPAWLPHPVVLMGRCISRLEKFLRARLPGTPQGELLGGAVTAFCLPVGTFLVTSLVCLAAAKLSPWLGLAVQMFWCGQALAAKGLAQESTNVYNELVRNDLPAARKAVSRIVGRDTQDLTAEGVTKGRGGNGGRKCQRRRHCAAAVYAHRRGTAGADLQGYQYHGQHAGLQEREVPLFWPCSREAGRCGQLHPQPPCRPFVGGGCGLYRKRCQRCMAHLAAGPALPRQPQQRPDPKAPAPVHWACSWPARLTILANITPSPPSVMPCAPLSRRTSCAPTA